MITNSWEQAGAFFASAYVIFRHGAPVLARRHEVLDQALNPTQPGGAEASSHETKPV